LRTEYNCTPIIPFRFLAAKTDSGKKAVAARATAPDLIKVLREVFINIGQLWFAIKLGKNPALAGFHKYSFIRFQ
jgi:hypothetical protein